MSSEQRNTSHCSGSQRIGTYQNGTPGVDEGILGVSAELGLVLVLDDKVQLVELPLLAEGPVQLGLGALVELLRLDEHVGQPRDEGRFGTDVLYEHPTFELLPGRRENSEYLAK